MADYVLSCCSTVDLTPEVLSEREIYYVPMHFFVNGKEYADDLGKSFPFPAFYQALRDGADTRTSQTSVGEYVAHFRPFLEAGRDVFHLSLSSGISGTFNSVCQAAEILKEEFPERKICVVDSLAASSGYGLLAETLADLRDAGKTMDELLSFTEERRLYLHHWFFSTDLSFYVKGGRISKAAGLFGGMMGICPLLNIDDEGHLTPREKIRSKKKVIQTIVDRMAEHAEGGEAYDGACSISHSDCFEDARAVADLIESRFPALNGKVRIFNVGTAIGSHTGPGTVALFFWGDRRTSDDAD